MRRAAVVLLALPLVAVACGGSKSSGRPSKMTPAAYVEQAAAKTVAAGSEHVTLKASVDVQGAKIDLTGAGDVKGKATRLRADFAAPGLSGTIDEVLVGTKLYLRSPLFSSALPAGKTWMKLDLQKAGKAQGIDFSALVGQNPSDSLAQLEGLKNVTEIGKEQIDGVDTTHYRGRVDASKLPAAVRGATYGPSDVWIDGDGHVRRVHASYTLRTQGAGATRADLTMTFSDFGKAVTITPPPAAEVADMTNKSIPGLGG